MIAFFLKLTLGLALAFVALVLLGGFIFATYTYVADWWKHR